MWNSCCKKAGIPVSFSSCRLSDASDRRRRRGEDRPEGGADRREAHLVLLYQAKRGPRERVKERVTGQVKREGDQARSGLQIGSGQDRRQPQLEIDLNSDFSRDCSCNKSLMQLQ